MKAAKTHIDLDGNKIGLDSLDAEEQALVARLSRRARSHPDWSNFGSYYLNAVAAFYDARGVSRRAAVRTVVFRIAQDLSSRLGIAAGLIRPDDYQSDLEEL